MKAIHLPLSVAFIAFCKLCKSMVVSFSIVCSHPSTDMRTFLSILTVHPCLHPLSCGASDDYGTLKRVKRRCLHGEIWRGSERGWDPMRKGKDVPAGTDGGSNEKRKCSSEGHQLGPVCLRLSGFRTENLSSWGPHSVLGKPAQLVNLTASPPPGQAHGILLPDGNSRILDGLPRDGARPCNSPRTDLNILPMPTSSPVPLPLPTLKVAAPFLSTSSSPTGLPPIDGASASLLSPVLRLSAYRGYLNFSP